MSDPLMGEQEHNNPELEGGMCGRCKMHYAEPTTLPLSPPDPTAEFDIVVGMPTSKIWVWMQEMDSYAIALTNLKLAYPKANIYKMNDSGLCVSAVRNRITKKFLDQGAPFLIFLDYDMVFHPLLLTTIIRALHDPAVDVYGGVYHARRYPYQPFLTDEWGRWIVHGSYPIGVQKVKRFGTGCIGFTRELFKSISKPFFRLTFNDEGELMETEDCYIGRKMEEVGIKAYVNTELLCQHLQMIQIPKFFESNAIQCNSLASRVIYDIAPGAKPPNQERHI
jgi:hypothetical protein